MKTRAATLLSIAFVLIAPHLSYSQSVRFEPQNKRYIGSTTGTNYPWTVTARTGLIDDACTSLMPCWGPDTIVRQSFSKWYVSENIKGFWEYLPDGYDDPANKDKTYPLMIYIHGCAGPGDGTVYLNGNTLIRSVGLGKILNEPLPGMLMVNPRYFSNIPIKSPGAQNASTGNRTSMIIMMPQYSGCQVPYFPGPEDIDACVEKAFSLYRVDRTRVYLTGHSGGGQPTYQYPAAKDEYARKITAIAPVCATQWLMGPRAEEYATRLVKNGVNVLGICNIYDYTIGGLTFRMNRLTMQNIMTVPGIAPYQADTAFFTYPGQTPNVSNHDAWRKAYHPNKPEYSSRIENYGGPLWTDPANGEGYNLYEWLVSKSKATILPVVDLNFTAKPDNNAVLLGWTAYPNANNGYEVERSKDGRRFTSIAKIGSLEQINREKYQFMDKALPQSPILYYRIRVLTNNKTDDITSKTVRIKNPYMDAGITIRESMIERQVVLVFSKRTSAFIRVHNTAGIPMTTKETSNTTEASIDLNGYNSGIYFVEVKTATGNTRIFRVFKR